MNWFPWFLVPLLALMSGCGSVERHEFVVKAAPQLQAQSDLATTAYDVAKLVDSNGSAPNSPDSKFLLGAVRIWLEQTGIGSAIERTEVAISAEAQKIASAKLVAEQAAVEEQQKLQTRIRELEEKLKERLLADMWAKLGAILAVGLAATVAASWFGGTRRLAPVVAIGFSSLAGVVVVRACSGDLMVVGLLALGTLALYGLGLWLLDRRRYLVAGRMLASVVDGVESASRQLDAGSAAVVKAEIRNSAMTAGTQEQLNDELVVKGYSGGKK